MKQIIKKGIVFLLAVVMMTCQSSILSLAEEERETTENTDNEEKEQKETEDTKETVSYTHLDDGTVDCKSLHCRYSKCTAFFSGQYF